MPLLRFDLIEGRSPPALQALLDATHKTVLAAFGVPARDRYQIVHEHKPSHMIALDTGLGIMRTNNFVSLQITTRPRTTAEKQNFYRLLCETLSAECGIAPSDVMVSCIENKDEDWSFGHGRAQFLTGEL
jgi:phenylpyruvate tautomerase PptA (4-oxalocrotonate tautomerase family)